MEPAMEEFVDGQNYAFEDGKERTNRRHSLAALKDIVTGKKDWWEKKANKTGAVAAKGSKVATVALPNMAAQKQRGLLFSLQPQDSTNSADLDSGSVNDASARDARPQYSVSQSMPHFKVPAVAVPDALHRSPSDRDAKGFKKILNKLTGRSPKSAAGSPSPQPSATSSPMPSPRALASFQRESSAPVAFGSPTASPEAPRVLDDDTRNMQHDQQHAHGNSPSPPASTQPSEQGFYSADTGHDTSCTATEDFITEDNGPEVQSVIESQHAEAAVGHDSPVQPSTEAAGQDLLPAPILSDFPSPPVPPTTPAEAEDGLQDAPLNAKTDVEPPVPPADVEPLLVASAGVLDISATAAVMQPEPTVALPTVILNHAIEDQVDQTQNSMPAVSAKQEEQQHEEDCMGPHTDQAPGTPLCSLQQGQSWAMQLSHMDAAETPAGSAAATEHIAAGECTMQICEALVMLADPTHAASAPEGNSPDAATSCPASDPAAHGYAGASPMLMSPMMLDCPPTVDIARTTFHRPLEPLPHEACYPAAAAREDVAQLSADVYPVRLLDMAEGDMMDVGEEENVGELVDSQQLEQGDDVQTVSQHLVPDSMATAEQVQPGLQVAASVLEPSLMMDVDSGEQDNGEEAQQQATAVETISTALENASAGAQMEVLSQSHFSLMDAHQVDMATVAHSVAMEPMLVQTALPSDHGEQAEEGEPQEQPAFSQALVSAAAGVQLQVDSVEDAAAADSSSYGHGLIETQQATVPEHTEQSSDSALLPASAVGEQPGTEVHNLVCAAAAVEVPASGSVAALARPGLFNNEAECHGRSEMDVDMDMEEVADCSQLQPAEQMCELTEPPHAEEGAVAAAPHVVAEAAPTLVSEGLLNAENEAQQASNLFPLPVEAGYEFEADDAEVDAELSMAALEAWMNGGMAAQQELNAALDAAEGAPQAEQEEQDVAADAAAPLPASPALFAAPWAAGPLPTEPPAAELAALSFEPMDLLSMDCQGGFSFDAEVPPLESTPSPVANRKTAQGVPFAKDMRDSIPLFSDRQSFAMQDSINLDRLSLDDIAPFSRKKQQQQPTLDTLLEDPDLPLGVSAGGAGLEEAAVEDVWTMSPMPQTPAHRGITPKELPTPPNAIHAAVLATPVAPTTAAAVPPAPRSAVLGRTALAGAAMRGAAATPAGSKTAAAAASTAAATAAASLRTPGGSLSGRTRGGAWGATPAATAAEAPASSAKGQPAKAAGSAARPAHDAASTPLTQQAGARKITSAIKAGTASKPLHSAHAAGTPAAAASANLRRPGSSWKPTAAQQQPAPQSTIKQAVAAVPAMPVAAAAPSADLSHVQPMPMQHSPAAAMLAAAQQTPQQPANLLPSSWATPLAQMAALPLDAALHMPLMDNSPFLEDWANDTSNIAEEARKLFSTLASEEVSVPVGAPARPGGRQANAARTPVNAGAGKQQQVVPLPSPNSVQILEMQMAMMFQKLADAENRQAALEKENEGLRDQLCTMQFQSGMPSEGADDMERQARQCAEEQLAVVTQRMQAAEEALGHHKREGEELRERSASLQRKLEEERATSCSELEALRGRLNEASRECEASTAHAESALAQLSSKSRECDAFQSALLAEQRHVDELRQTVKSKEAEIAQLHQSNSETSAKLQKALESLTSVQVGQRRQAAETESKMATLTDTMERLREDRDTINQELVQATARLKEADVHVAQVKKELAAAAAENKELLAMCNHLVSQVEESRKA